MMSAKDSATAKPRFKVDPALIITIFVGCIAGYFVVKYAATTIPNRAVGGLAANVAGDVKVEEKPLYELGAVGDVRGIGFASDGNLFVGDRDGLTLRDPKTGKTVRTFDTDGNGVRTAAATPGGGAIAAGLSYSGEVRFFGANEPKPVLSFRSVTDQEQQSVAFSPDGESIAAGGFDKTVRVYRAGDAAAPKVKAGSVFDTTKQSGTKAKLESLPIKAGDTISAVCFAPDGKTLAVATGPKATIYDAKTGKAGQVLFADKETITAVAFAPDGKTLAVGAASGVITLFETATGRQSGEIKGLGETGKNANAFGLSGNNSGGVSAMIYAPNGKSIYAALKSGILSQSDVATGKSLKLFAPDASPLPAALSLALSPDAKRAALGYADGSVRVWDLK
ncbi:MAG: PQQ-binding-like beta-propeller repeat protein [Armatimonadetes bacterium]|nr:PQQ-binding-like beta-propeller repeat protein [Armatimonadota bacterium]